MARPISRGVLSFGLVSIPVELYSAIEDHNIRFHLLHKKCGSRVRNQLFCPVCKVVIERDETVRGYEVTKGQYVRVEDAELEALEAEANSSIEMREFIPIEKVDPIYFESSYYLAPDKGADINRIGCSPRPWRRLVDAKSDAADSFDNGIVCIDLLRSFVGAISQHRGDAVCCSLEMA